MIKVFVISISLNGSYVDRIAYLNEKEIVINEKYYLENSKGIVEEKNIYYVLGDDVVQEISNDEKKKISISLYQSDSWKMEGFHSKKILEESLEKQSNGEMVFIRNTNYGNEQFLLEKNEVVGIPNLFNLTMEVKKTHYIIAKHEIFYTNNPIYKSDLIESRVGLEQDIKIFNSIKGLF